MIRDAVYADIEEMLVLCRHFFDATAYPEYMDFSEEVTRETLQNLIDNELGIALVLDDDGIKGIITALIFPLYMSGAMTGQELCWWCEEKGKGMLLLTALEREAKRRGAETFMMLSLDQLQPQRLDRLYQAKGYHRSEHTYIRRL